MHPKGLIKNPKNNWLHLAWDTTTTGIRGLILNVEFLIEKDFFFLFSPKFNTLI